jgi:bifunctional non-homologous end joining protein LigD
MLSATIVQDKPIGKHERFDSPVTWVKPKYFCNVRFTEITDDGILTHPIFTGIRVDKEYSE